MQPEAFDVQPTRAGLSLQWAHLTILTWIPTLLRRPVAFWEGHGQGGQLRAAPSSSEQFEVESPMTRGPKEGRPESHDRQSSQSFGS